MKIDLTNERLIYRAYKKSLNNRSYLASSQNFAKDPFNKNNLLKIQQQLKDKTYKVSGYTEFRVTHPKERIILACHFRDKIVQHVLCDNVLAPKLPEICIIDNYSGQIGKGTLFARERLRYYIKLFIDEYEDGYCFKGDIHKYYYNINHNIAKQIMHKHYDKEYWWLIDKFIDSTEGNVGVPLGNQINTILSCLYLNELDQYIKNELNIKYYGRYADDFFILEKDKDKLKYYVKKIEEFLNNKLKLELNPKSQITPMKNGTKFIGFHFYVNESKEITIKLINSKRREHYRKFNKMVKLFKNNKIPLSNLIKSQISWEAHASYATDVSFDYYHKIMEELIMDYYISECCSNIFPKTRLEEDILYLPFNIKKNEDNTFSFFELRMDIETYTLGEDIISNMIKKTINDITPINNADVLKLNELKKTI